MSPRARRAAGAIAPIAADVAAWRQLTGPPRPPLNAGSAGSQAMSPAAAITGSGGAGGRGGGRRGGGGGAAGRRRWRDELVAQIDDGAPGADLHPPRTGRDGRRTRADGEYAPPGGATGGDPHAAEAHGDVLAAPEVGSAQLEPRAVGPARRAEHDPLPA